MPKHNYTTRSLTLDDAQKFVETNKVISADLGTNRSYQADYIQAQWEEPGFDITQSSYGIFTENGELVGFVVIWDNIETPVRPWIEWGVHPDYLNYDLSKQLLEWADQTTQRIIDRCPPNARLSLQTMAVKDYKPTEDRLTQAGYIPIRSSYDLQIDMETPPTPPNLPDGFKLRSYNANNDEDLLAYVYAFRDSFSDHFGYVDESFEKDLKEFRHWFNTDPLFDPNVFLLAIDKNSGEIAGFVLGMKQEHGNPDVGWVEFVGVRRAYRRCGLARTLLLHVFNAFWNQSKKSVTLQVDGESLTNALSLYEKIGMTVKFQYVRYEKLIRDGEELAKVSAE
jgi:mycothiol synthase